MGKRIGRPPRADITEFDVCWLWVQRKSDRVIAKALGCSDLLVARRRHTLGLHVWNEAVIQMWKETNGLPPRARDGDGKFAAGGQVGSGLTTEALRHGGDHGQG